MNFSIDRKFFLDKLNIVSRAISVFSPLPALSGICIEVKNNQMILTGSDSNISIRTTIVPGEINNLVIKENGSIIIEAKYLLEIVRKMDCPSLNFELIDYSLVCISNEKGKFNLNGIQANEYPNIDFDCPQTHISLKSGQLKAIVNQTAFACSDKDTRPVLNGVNFKAHGTNLSCSGTDSYRLARKNIELSESNDFDITIPNKSLVEVVRSFADDETDVDLFIDRKKVQFVFDKTIFQTRLIDGIFPDIDRIIPSNCIATLIVDAKELSSVIDRTNFIRNEKIHLIKLECSKDEVHIKTNSSEIGNSDEILTTCQYDGDDIRLSCNGTYMLEAVKAINGTKAKLEFSGLMKPIKITNPDDDSIIMIVVPIRSYD